MINSKTTTNARRDAGEYTSREYTYTTFSTPYTNKNLHIQGNMYTDSIVSTNTNRNTPCHMYSTAYNASTTTSNSKIIKNSSSKINTSAISPLTGDNVPNSYENSNTTDSKDATGNTTKDNTGLTTMSHLRCNIETDDNIDISSSRKQVPTYIDVLKNTARASANIPPNNVNIIIPNRRKNTITTKTGNLYSNLESTSVRNTNTSERKLTRKVHKTFNAQYSDHRVIRVTTRKNDTHKSAIELLLSSDDNAYEYELDYNSDSSLSITSSLAIHIDIYPTTTSAPRTVPVDTRERPNITVAIGTDNSTCVHHTKNVPPITISTARSYAQLIRL